MANLLETSEIKWETVDNLISDQRSRDVTHRNRSFILECPDCKKKFCRMILFLQHREALKKNRKFLDSENKKKQRKRRLLDRLTNNAAFNYEKHTEKLNCNNDITNKEVVGAEHEKNVSLECETQPREEIKIEVKDEFECSEYTLTPFTHYGVHIEKKDFVEEDESKHTDKSEDEKRKRHQVKDNALRPFQCEICDRTFARKRKLTEHFRIHTGEKPFECKICSSRYRIEVSLINHSARVHTNDKPFQCKICPLRFKTKPNLAQHSWRQHLHNGKQTFECEICSKTFTRKDDLKRHQRVHTDDRPFQCKICPKRFKTKPALVKHSYSKHPADLPYKSESFECDVCQKKFPYKTEFFRHKSIHTGEKPFNCAVCQKGYTRKLDLVQHLKRHTGNTKGFIDDSEYSSFKCEICSKTFMRKEHLKNHQRVHDSPFQCIVCTLKFKTKSVLVKHSYKQHPEDNPYDCKKDYRCDVCQKKFLYKSDMVYHRKQHTEGKHLESFSGNEREKDENLVLERCSEENASLQCEVPTKEEIKIEVNEEFECSEYTLQPFTYHGVHIENNGVEEYESKDKCNDLHEERKHQVREDVTDSESHDHCYFEEKLEKHKFNEPYPEVVDIKEDTNSENYS